ncbi:hypothetical protein SAMN06295998_104179 [Primorskyibacter flagellatus]|uniref:Uncharacterized protein n=1 Tax=Primorskyibacter flagellatus TaxID=1387277 RepID=A0A1W2BM80_9RHOB|nr:hypothetical protein SAMN06295998_104179 [Primorskyibacter flagellatus]
MRQHGRGQRPICVYAKMNPVCAARALRQIKPCQGVNGQTIISTGSVTATIRISSGKPMRQ